MKREIKFRTWHKGCKAMTYFDTPTLDEEYSDLSFNISDESSEYWYNHKDNHGNYLPGAYRCWGKWQYNAPKKYDLNNIELMQYTGLKDKNGKDIYEGDIVFYESNMWAVEFSGDCWDMMKNGSSIRCDDEPDDIGFTDWEKCEILGNIYENPELL